MNIVSQKYSQLTDSIAGWRFVGFDSEESDANSRTHPWQNNRCGMTDRLINEQQKIISSRLGQVLKGLTYLRDHHRIMHRGKRESLISHCDMFIGRTRILDVKPSNILVNHQGETNRHIE